MKYLKKNYDLWDTSSSHLIYFLSHSSNVSSRQLCVVWLIAITVGVLSRVFCHGILKAESWFQELWIFLKNKISKLNLGTNVEVLSFYFAKWGQLTKSSIYPSIKSEKGHLNTKILSRNKYQTEEQTFMKNSLHCFYCIFSHFHVDWEANA